MAPHTPRGKGMNQNAGDRIESAGKRLFLGFLRLFIRETAPAPQPGGISFRNILLIRQHDQLGDMLCIVPLLRALRQRYPDARISLVAGRVNRDIMLHHPYLDEVLLFPRGRYAAMAAFFRRLRRAEYDLVIVPSTVSVSVTSGLIAVLAGAAVRIGPGSIDGIPASTKVCFSHPIDLDWRTDPHRHQVLRNLDIGKPLALPTAELTTCIGLTAEEGEDADFRLRELRSRHPILIGIHPGAGKGENRWPGENFAEVVNRCARQFNAGIVITSGPQDVDVRDRLLPLLRCGYLLLDRQPLRSVAAVIDRTDLFISNDTGIMHIAGAVRTRLLALFGPTDALQWMPPGERHRCLCGAGGDVGAIRVDDVCRHAEEMLEGKNRRHN